MIIIGRDFKFDGEFVKSSDNSISGCLKIPEDIFSDELKDIFTKENLICITDTNTNEQYFGFINLKKMEINNDSVSVVLELATISDMIKDLYKMMYDVKVGGLETNKIYNSVIAYLDDNFIELVIKQLGGKG